MLYRVRIDLAFTTPGVYAGLVLHAEGIISQAHTINPGQINEEKGYIKTEQCYHDEDPSLPCNLIEEQYTD